MQKLRQSISALLDSTSRRVVWQFGAAAACFGLLVAAYGQVASPGGHDQDAILSRVRESALNYAERLHDFVCIQKTERSADNSGSGTHWKRLDTQELEVSYVSHKETYRLLRVNGKTDNLEKAIKRGYFRPGSEFGSAFRWVFEPQAGAIFEWHREESDAGKRLCVFRYRVPQATSTLKTQADLDIVQLAHHGFVYADCDTGAVVRLQLETEAASVKRSGRDVAVGTQLDIRYAPTTIDSRPYLLPQTAEEIARFGKTLTKAEIRFDHYQRFGSKATVTFDDGESKANTPPR